MYAKKQRIQICFNKAAKTYDQAANLQREAADDLFKLLPQENFNQVLDLGTGTGYCARILAKKLPQAEILGIDIAPEMIQVAKQKQHHQEQYLIADFDNLPIQSESCDLIFSNLALQWSLNLDNTLAKLKHALAKKGHLVFSTLLNGTLLELKKAFHQIDKSRHANDFLDLKQVEKILLKNNFEIIKTKTATKKYHYRNVFEIIRNLKDVGANCVIEHSTKQLTHKQHFIKLNQCYPRQHQIDQLPLSYELAYFCVRNKT